MSDHSFDVLSQSYIRKGLGERTKINTNFMKTKAMKKPKSFKLRKKLEKNTQLFTLLGIFNAFLIYADHHGAVGSNIIFIVFSILSVCVAWLILLDFGRGSNIAFEIMGFSIFVSQFLVLFGVLSDDVVYEDFKSLVFIVTWIILSLFLGKALWFLYKIIKVKSESRESGDVKFVKRLKLMTGLIAFVSIILAMIVVYFIHDIVNDALRHLIDEVISATSSL